ncbi:ribokinase [Leucobacter massiliensis]|uniref:Ribokinase n=1 Tax=Leucobacter massiliensis TaxID=1686285 RepID=A0A2S9QNX7_9MICO|nr:ribokinase [Leucobacter massiliensis]PRI11284.1 hypothetical protein B4915_10605 [Leucobacter massiliensis]
MSGAVLVVGSANADLVAEVPRRPGAGETLLGGDLRLLPGGKGANQAVAAARCGAATVMLGCVGRDANGAFLRERLIAAGVEVSGLAEVDRPTGAALILVTPDGENSIVVAPGANAEAGPELLERGAAALADARILVLSLEIPAETAFAFAAAAARSGTRTVFNAAPARSIPAEVLRSCDPLIVNEHEACAALGEPETEVTDFEALARRLLAAGARSVVITLGAEGAVVAEGTGGGDPVVARIAAHRVRAVDTTGAGDAFVGAVACELARGAELDEAVRFATAVSAMVVQRLGAQSSVPERAETEAYLAR